MSLLDKAEKKLRRFALRNVTIYLIAGQVFVFVLSYVRPEKVVDLALIAAEVQRGEVWRLVTFLFMPPLTNPIFAFFAWYLFLLMGTALERQWGAFRYNVFLLIGWGATVAVSFLTPYMPMTNLFILGSVFLAFAHLYPDFQILLLFFIPVKIKYLAWATWLGYLYAIGEGSWADRAAILASVANFVLFFGKDIFLRLIARQRRVGARMKFRKAEDEPRHRCAVCGITPEKDRSAEFRYCGECEPTTCYCLEHIFNHEHVGKKRKKAKV